MVSANISRLLIQIHKTVWTLWLWFGSWVLNPCSLMRQYEHMPPYATWSFTKGPIENTFVVARYSKNRTKSTNNVHCNMFNKHIKHNSQGEFQNCEPGTFCSRLANLSVVERFESQILSMRLLHVHICIFYLLFIIYKSRIQCFKPRPYFIIVMQNNA